MESRYVIEETKLGIQKISKAILREVNEPEHEMENIYEMTFSLKIKQRGLLHNGIEKAQLKNAQTGQRFLGIREGSVQAFRTGIDGRKRIRKNQERDSHQDRNSFARRNFGPRASGSRALSESQSQNLNQAEYVEVLKGFDMFNDQHIEIKWMFNDPKQAASHFEFEFKLGLS